MIQSIPLKKLAASPRNVRKSSDVLADLQLRADIAARGLLQNLVVRKGKRGKFEVEAGGRRLAALQALAEEGTLPENHEVTCLVIEVLFAEAGRKPGQIMGKTPWLQSVYAQGDPRLFGRIVDVRLIEGYANSLLGEIVTGDYEVAA